MQRSIISMVLMILVVAVILFFAAPYMDSRLVGMIIAVVGIGCLLWFLQMMGYLPGPPGP